MESLTLKVALVLSASLLSGPNFVETLTPMAPVGQKALKGKISIRVDDEKEKKLRALPSWQDKLRKAIDDLIESESTMAS